MHIVHIVHSYFPRIGGIERAVQFLAEKQAEMGHKVTVLTSDAGLQRVARVEIINGVEVRRLRSRRIVYNDLTVAVEKPVLRDFDIVHAHSQNSLYSVQLSEFLKEKTGCRVAFHFMAVDAFGDHPSPLIRLLAPHYGRMCLKRALRVTDLPLVRSRRDMTILRERYGVIAEYLPDGVSEIYFTARQRNPVEFLEKYKIKQDKFFLFIGRMHKLKGPHVLVEALKYLDKDIGAVFIGPDDGYLRNTLELARKLDVIDRVYVLGYVSEEDKIMAIDLAVALVLPSIADYVEVYPMVISEAWAREKPVIGTCVGGIPYRINHGLNGLLVRPSDPKALADAMRKLAYDRGLATEMGKQGRKEVHTWRDIAVRSIHLYNQTG